MSFTGKWPTTTEYHLMIKLINYSTFNNMTKENKTKGSDISAQQLKLESSPYVIRGTACDSVQTSPGACLWTNQRGTYGPHSWLRFRTQHCYPPVSLLSFLIPVNILSGSELGTTQITSNSSTWNLEFKASWALHRMLQKQIKTC